MADQACYIFDCLAARAKDQGVMGSSEEGFVYPVLSASRSKDMVRFSSQLLADILEGRVLCRPGFRRPETTIDIEKVGALVLWTKDPSPLLDHPALSRAVASYAARRLVVLQLTVTAFGASPVEPLVPPPDQVWASVGRLIDRGVLFPEAIVLRYDPFGEVRFGPGLVLSNMDLGLFRAVAEPFRARGGEVVVASPMDNESYPKLDRRMARVGAAMEPLSEAAALAFSERLAEECRHMGLTFTVCVNPGRSPLVQVRGCIDGRWINGLAKKRLGEGAVRVTEALHNAVGRQRPGCLCTYSYDLGHTAGSRHCFPQGSGCLYCFSQGEGMGKAMEAKVRQMVEALITNPIEALASWGALRSLLKSNEKTEPQGL